VKHLSQETKKPFVWAEKRIKKEHENLARTRSALACLARFSAFIRLIATQTKERISKWGRLVGYETNVRTVC
jgi:hypothetical protein